MLSVARHMTCSRVVHALEAAVATAIGLGLPALAACKKPEPHQTASVSITERPDSLTAAVADSGAPSGLTGIWTVVAHHTPGVSAMDSAQAAAWHGETVRLMPSKAVAPGVTCNAPVYRNHTVQRDSFLATEYRLAPGSLPRLASVEHLTVLDVACGGTHWVALGGVLIQIDGRHALAPWDGVFFELERDQDLRAMGQEPFWRLEITKGIEIRLVQLGKTDVVTPVPRPTTDPRTGTRVYRAVTEANDLTVAIEPTPCTDSMSGKLFELTVVVTLNGGSLHGCGAFHE